jgi:hypothetical protein
LQQRFKRRRPRDDAMNAPDRKRATVVARHARLRERRARKLLRFNYLRSVPHCGEAPRNMCRYAVSTRGGGARSQGSAILAAPRAAARQRCVARKREEIIVKACAARRRTRDDAMAHGSRDCRHDLRSRRVAPSRAYRRALSTCDFRKRSAARRKFFVDSGLLPRNRVRTLSPA